MMKPSVFSLPAFAVMSAAGLLTPSGVQASTITFDTTFSVTDTINASASGLSAGESLDLNFDSGRVAFTGASLPRFDPSLGRLDSVTLGIVFDRSTVSLPITFTDPAGGVTTAAIDEVNLRRGLVFGVNTGLLRPQVITSGTETTLDLTTLTANGLLTTPSTSSVQVDIGTTGAGSFILDEERAVSPVINQDPDNAAAELFSFTGTEDFGFVFRRLSEISVSADQDGLDLAIVDGRIEYSGTVSVTFGFTPIPEPASLALLGSGALLLLPRRRQVG